MNNVIGIMVEVDKLLDKLSVKGDDVFILADARKLMKLAFDEITKPPKDEKAEGDS